MTTERMIEVMQAYVDGDQIEYKEKEGVSEYHEWELLDIVPSWDWYKFDYRVKPKATYRPYKNAEEFLRGQKEHGIFLVISDIFNDCYVLPLCVNEFVKLSYNSIKNGPVEKLAAYDFLFDNCIWQDGTPCGVKK